MHSSQEWGGGRGNEIRLHVTKSQLDKIVRAMDEFSLDTEGSSRPFSRRLQEQQGWTKEYTDRAITEYKRFMVLAAVSSQEVTPSKTVDEVWHFHLQYSRSYREEMCQKILGKHIDHNPGDGADGEDAHYSGQYLKTLLLYTTVFGEKPPGDIWQFSEFDKAGLEKGIGLVESRKDKERASASSSDSDSSFFIFADTSFPERPSAPESSFHKSPTASAVPSDGGNSPGGFWSSVREFFGFGSAESGPESGHGKANSHPAPSAEVDSSTGGWSIFESLGFGGGSEGSSSSSSSCSSASSCGGGGSSCGGGGCGGGGCGGS